MTTKSDPLSKEQLAPWRFRFWLWRRDVMRLYRIRAVALRIALGGSTFDYMNRSVKTDKRTPSARMVDIIIRKDGREERIEADWVKTIARIIKHVEPKRL